MPLPPIVAVEVGTSKVITLVGEARDDGCVMVTGMGESPSTGVRKGEVTDVENAALCVRSSIEKAEEMGKVSIRQIHLALSAGHIQSLVNRGAVPVISKDGEITAEDVEEVMEVAGAIHLPPDRDVLHTICQHFCIDDQTRVIRPEKMEGARLSLDMLVLHGVRARLHNTVRVLRTIPVEVRDVAFGGLCSALAVLTPEQKKSGVIVIDMGGGTTDYLAYAGGVVASAGALGVGGDHVTNDIALGLSIPISRAESLKCESGSAIIESPESDKKVSLPPEVGFPGRTVALRTLNTIIHARVDEIFETVRKRLEAVGVLHQVGAGVVLTGGGAHLKGFASLAEQAFGVPAAIGRPRNVSGLARVAEPEYSTCSGLTQYAFRTMSDERSQMSPFGWLKGLFGR